MSAAADGAVRARRPDTSRPGFPAAASKGLPVELSSQLGCAKAALALRAVAVAVASSAAEADSESELEQQQPVAVSNTRGDRS